ncbi:EF-hand domain-containing protein [Streptomyces longwoodensis]|uniref:EF-hand domain-containing protein n=1 Tax=Streptomyces longwoodensis TaxID=68231 RepID=UPI00369AD3A5
MLTPDEQIMKAFNDIDSDGDGYISPSELKAWSDANDVDYNAFDKIVSADRNFDNKISAEEWRNASLKLVNAGVIKFNFS